jgi:pimeloyl-ACP methyl ester carboxylesterase
VAADAVDAGELIRALDVSPAHVVGVSYSAAVALSLASRAPELVHTLTVVEPPPVGTPGAAAFQRANGELLKSYEDNGPEAALDQFMTRLVGEAWRTVSERDSPGSVQTMKRDAPTFFSSDIPALLSWSFDATDAAKIRCPVLYVGGSESGSWFTDMRAVVLGLLTHADQATVEGADHLVATTHCAELAALVLEHVRRHPRPQLGE